MNVDRPQYGEYASPDEQRARAGLPPLDQSEPAAPADVPVSAPPAPAARTVPGGNRVERMITAVLLGVGFVNVLGSIPGFLDLSSSLQQSLTMLGSDAEFTNFAAARTWGTVAVVVLFVGYAITAWFAVRRLLRGRSSWWIPLVGCVATMLLVMACVSVPMFGDPAFLQAVTPTPTPSG